MSERKRLPHQLKKLLDEWLGSSPDDKAAKKNWSKLQECMSDDFLICCIACHQKFSKDNNLKPPKWYQAGNCKGFGEDGSKKESVICFLHNEKIV